MLDSASPLGGDVEEIGHFQSGKIRPHGSSFFASPLGGDVAKIGDVRGGKSIVVKTMFFC